MLRASLVKVADLQAGTDPPASVQGPTSKLFSLAVEAATCPDLAILLEGL